MSETPEPARDSNQEANQEAIDDLESGPPFDDRSDRQHHGEPLDRVLDESTGGPGPAELEPPPRPPRKPSVARSSVLAAAMLGLRDALEGPKKEVIAIQAESPGEPPDIDHTGLRAELDDGRVATGPPLDDLKSKAAAARRSERARRRAARRR